MGLIIHRQQLVRREVRIFLRGVERGVAQHFLDRAEIGPLVQQMGGK